MTFNMIKSILTDEFRDMLCLICSKLESQDYEALTVASKRFKYFIVNTHKSSTGRKLFDDYVDKKYGKKFILKEYFQSQINDIIDSDRYHLIINSTLSGDDVVNYVNDKLMRIYKGIFEVLVKEVICDLCLSSDIYLNNVSIPKNHYYFEATSLIDVMLKYHVYQINNKQNSTLVNLIYNLVNEFYNNVKGRTIIIPQILNDKVLSRNFNMIIDKILYIINVSNSFTLLQKI